MKKLFILVSLILIPFIAFAQSGTLRDGTKYDKTTGTALAISTNQVVDNQEAIEELSQTSSLFYFTDESSPSGEYLLMTTTFPGGAESSVVSELASATVVVTSFTIETPLTLDRLRAGQYHFHFHAEVDNASKETKLRLEVYKGTGTANAFLFSTGQSGVVTTDKTFYDAHISTNEILGNVGFLAARVIADVTGGGPNPVLTFYMEGDSESNFEMPALAVDVGVTKLIPGTNITASPDLGRGDVTVNLDPVYAESTGAIKTPYDVVIGFQEPVDFLVDGTDDDVQINAALAYAQQFSSPTILCKQGVYDIQNRINTHNAGTLIQGESWGTLFSSFINEDWVISLDHDKCGVRNISFEPQSGPMPNAAVHVNADDCYVENNYIHKRGGAFNGAIEVATGKLRALISKNNIADTTAGVGISIKGSDCIVSDNYIKSDPGISLFLGSRNNLISDNVLRGTRGFIIAGDSNTFTSNDTQGISGDDYEITGNENHFGYNIQKDGTPFEGDLLLKSGGTLTGDLNFGGNDATNIGLVDGQSVGNVSKSTNAIIANTTHRSSNGSDHGFIDQDVTIGASPTFDGSNITGLSSDASLYVQFRIRKNSAGTIPTGFPVYAVGLTTNAFSVTLVEQADSSDPNKMPAIGIAIGQVTASATSFVLNSGKLGNQDTSAWGEGDELWVATSTALGLTNVKPIGTNLIQKVAEVIGVGTSSGCYLAFGAGRTNDIPNIPENQFWLGDSNGVPQATDLDIAVLGVVNTSTGSICLVYPGIIEVSSITAFGTGVGCYFGSSVTITEIRAVTIDKSFASAITVDLHLVTSSSTHTTIYSTQGNRPTIAANKNEGASTVPDTTAIPKDSRLALHIDDKGDGNARDLMVYIKYWKTFNQ